MSTVSLGLTVTEWGVGCWLDMGMTRTASKLTMLCMLNMSGWSPNTSQPFLPLPSHAAVQSIKYHNVSCLLTCWLQHSSQICLMKAGRGWSLIISPLKNTNYSSRANVKSLQSSNDLERNDHTEVGEMLQHSQGVRCSNWCWRGLMVASCTVGEIRRSGEHNTTSS